MEPIINPWIFYLIDVIGKLQGALMFLCGAMGIALMLMILSFLTEDESFDIFSTKRNILFKRISICFVISAILCIITPSRATMYKMVAASFITPNNIEYLHDKTLEDIDKIIDSLATKLIEKSR